MNRKIRIWDGKYKRYMLPEDTIYNITVNLAANVVSAEILDGRISATGIWVLLDTGEMISEQCTGLQDKNGQDVYEGDILGNGSGRICKVCWHKKTGAWDTNPLNDIGDAHGFRNTNWSFMVSIQGNIHENPELL